MLAVTGALGAARAGLELAREFIPLEGSKTEALRAFRRPEARVAEGRFLAASRNVRAMMDLSDGLATDVRRLAAASGCGAELENVPVAQAARALCERAKKIRSASRSRAARISSCLRRSGRAPLRISLRATKPASDASLRRLGYYGGSWVSLGTVRRSSSLVGITSRVRRGALLDSSGGSWCRPARCGARRGRRCGRIANSAANAASSYSSRD